MDYWRMKVSSRSGRQKTHSKSVFVSDGGYFKDCSNGADVSSREVCQVYNSQWLPSLLNSPVTQLQFFYVFHFFYNYVIYYLI